MDQTYCLSANDASIILGVSVRRIHSLATCDRAIRYRTVNARRKLYHVGDVLAALHDRKSLSGIVAESQAAMKPPLHMPPASAVTFPESFHGGNA